jgi:hypothetical protein
MPDVQHLYVDTVDPSGAPPDLNVHHINSTTKKAWISVGTSSFADWIQLGDITVAEEYESELTIDDATNASYTIPSDAKIVHINLIDNGIHDYIRNIYLPAIIENSVQLVYLYVRTLQVITNSSAIVTGLNFYTNNPLDDIWVNGVREDGPYSVPSGPDRGLLTKYTLFADSVLKIWTVKAQYYGGRMNI